MTRPIGYNRAVQEARDLIEPESADWGDAKTIEYARGQCELLAAMFPERDMLTPDRAQEIARSMNIPERGVERMYKRAKR